MSGKPSKETIDSIKQTVATVAETTTRNREYLSEIPEGFTEQELNNYVNAKTVKEAMRIYVSNHKDGLAGFVQTVQKMARKDPRWADMYIRLLGGYSPTQIDSTLEVKQPTPLEDLQVIRVKKKKKK